MAEPSFKVVLVGSSGVGKTSIAKSFIHGRFDINIDSTIGAAFHFRRINGVALHLWDTAGQERYRSLIPMYVRGSNMIILVK